MTNTNIDTNSQMYRELRKAYDRTMAKNQAINAWFEDAEQHFQDGGFPQFATTDEFYAWLQTEEKRRRMRISDHYEQIRAQFGKDAPTFAEMNCFVRYGHTDVEGMPE